jgi:hypothetical protein
MTRRGLGGVRRGQQNWKTPPTSGVQPKTYQSESSKIVIGA